VSSLMAQDCELKVFYRLAEKIKHTYKRLPICMLADSLYACEPVFKVCDGNPKNRWQYLMRFKEGRIRSIAAEFRAITDIEQRKEGEQLYWANDIAYNERSVHLLELNLETEEGKTQQYLWITSIKITKRNAQRLADGGRRTFGTTLNMPAVTITMRRRIIICLLKSRILSCSCMKTGSACSRPIKLGLRSG